MPAGPVSCRRRCRSRRGAGRGGAPVGCERRRQDHVAPARGGARAPLFGRSGGLGSRSRSGSQERVRRGTWRSSATRPSATTISPCARTSVSRRGPPAATSRRQTPRSSDWVSGARPTSRTAGSPRGSDGGSRSQLRWRANQRCCCSTSPTPGSTVKVVPCWTTYWPPRPREGRTVLLASHELEHAVALAGREVVLTGGQADGRLPAAPASSSPAPEPVGSGATRTGEP